MRLVVILSGLLLLLPLHAQEEEPKITYHSRRDFNEWRERLRGFDEIRMTLAAKRVSVPKMKKDGSMEFVQQLVRDTPLHSSAGVFDTDTFLSLLEFEANVPDAVHGCYGLFNLTFYKQGEVVGRLHYAHGKYWQPLTPRSQEAVSGWLIQHRFPIKETMKLDQEEANQSPEPTAASGRGSP